MSGRSTETSADGCGSGGGGGGGEIMLFGVRVVVDSMRKSVSLNNLSQYEQPEGNRSNGNGINGNQIKDKDDVAPSGYASADDAVPSSKGSRERKRGVPWTEDEHKLFLLGLQKVGKGDWRGISRNFVKTRTPTQVASHAQKYFLRRSNHNRRRRRSSLFDITTDSVTAVSMEEDQLNLRDTSPSQSHQLPPPQPETKINMARFPGMPAFPAGLPSPIGNPMENLTLGQANQSNNLTTKLIRPIPFAPAPQTSARSDLNLDPRSTIDPSLLSLKLSLPSNQTESSSRHSAFQVMPNFSNGDNSSIISVA